MCRWTFSSQGKICWTGLWRASCPRHEATCMLHGYMACLISSGQSRRDITHWIVDYLSEALSWAFPWSAYQSVLDGRNLHQCMNVCMNYCTWLWTKASDKCLKCKYFQSQKWPYLDKGGRAGEDSDWLCESLRTPPYEIDITLYRRLKTSTLDHRLIGELFTEQINQLESRKMLSKAITPHWPLKSAGKEST